nr:head GIN domain-containing protein [uncultured Flavobacterium sp.]
MKNLSIASILLLSFSSFLSYGQWNMGKQIKGNGNVITETRTTSSYDGIKVSGFFDVDLVSGKEGNITIKGEQNILDYINVEVVDNVLKIGTEKGYNFKLSQGKSVHITIPFESINGLVLSGSGDIVSKDIIKTNAFDAKLSGSGDLKLAVDAQKFNMSLSGSGDIVLTGHANDFSSSISGSGDINASDLKSKTVSVSISGSGDTKVSCSESLYARVSGSGDIVYYGNPAKKDTKVVGSGEISKG